MIPPSSRTFAADPLPIDVAEFHTYGVDWRPGSLAFSVDGGVVRRLDQAPDYPMQLMIGVFDFPAKAGGGDTEPCRRPSWSSPTSAAAVSADPGPGHDAVLRRR